MGSTAAQWIQRPGIWLLGSLISLALLVVATAFAPHPVQAAGTTYYVGSTADTTTTTNCTDPTNTTYTLRGAISIATSGSDTISFNMTVFPAMTAVTITLSGGTLTLGTSMTIDGTGHNVVIDGNCTVDMNSKCTGGGAIVFRVTTGVTVTLNTLTIQHGRNGGPTAVASKTTVHCSSRTAPLPTTPRPPPMAAPSITRAVRR